MKNPIELPQPYVDVMITFINRNGTRQIKRGFYSDAFSAFCIPPEYRTFNGRLLPHGFGGHHIEPSSKDIISWEEIKN